MSIQSPYRQTFADIVWKITGRFINSQRPWPQNWHEWTLAVQTFLQNEFNNLPEDLELLVVAILDHIILQVPLWPSTQETLTQLPYHLSPATEPFSRTPQTEPPSFSSTKPSPPEAPSADLDSTQETPESLSTVRETDQNSPSALVDPSQYFSIINPQTTRPEHLQPNTVYLIQMHEGASVTANQQHPFMFVRLSESLLKVFSKGRAEYEKLPTWIRVAQFGRQGQLSRRGLFTIRVGMGTFSQNPERLHDPTSTHSLQVSFEHLNHSQLGDILIVDWLRLARKPRR